MNQPNFFSIHAVKALENRAFSMVLSNVENTPEKLAFAKDLFSGEDWHFEFHNQKIDISVVALI